MLFYFVGQVPHLNLTSQASTTPNPSPFPFYNTPLRRSGSASEPDITNIIQCVPIKLARPTQFSPVSGPCEVVDRQVSN